MRGERPPRRWAVVVNGNEVEEVEATNATLAAHEGINQWRATTTGQRERREVIMLLVVRLDRDSTA